MLAPTLLATGCYVVPISPAPGYGPPVYRQYPPRRYYYPTPRPYYRYHGLAPDASTLGAGTSFADAAAAEPPSRGFGNGPLEAAGIAGATAAAAIAVDATAPPAPALDAVLGEPAASFDTAML